MGVTDGAIASQSISAKVSKKCCHSGMSWIQADGLRQFSLRGGMREVSMLSSGASKVHGRRGREWICFADLEALRTLLGALSG